MNGNKYTTNPKLHDSFLEFKEQLLYKKDIEKFLAFTYDWFFKIFHIDDIKITSYDIETGKDQTLLYVLQDFDTQDSHTIVMDFSKSLQVNGRIFFLFNDYTKKEDLQLHHQAFFDYVLKEITPFLQYFLLFEKFQDLSQINTITNLPNRKFLKKHLQSMLNVVQKEHLKLAFLKIEIDRLKAVVDEFDYQAANTTLKALSETIKNNICATDLATMFDDKTFMVCMQDVDSKSDVENLAKNIIEDFAKQNIIVDYRTNQILQKTACIGISRYPQDDTNIIGLFKKAEFALDEAKNLGRGSWKFFEEQTPIDLF